MTTPVLSQRVLVTGADGLIGRAVTERLLAAGMAVTALSPGWSSPTQADRRVLGSAADADLMDTAMADVTAVAHLGAIPHPSLGTPLEVFSNNTQATFNVLAAAGGRGIRRVVLASSINAFGVPMNSHPILPDHFPLDLHNAVHLDDAYSLSKATDEASARMAASRWGLEVLAIRFPFVRDAAGIRRHRDSLPPDEQARLVREGWAYLDLRDAADLVLAGLTGDFRGAHVVLAAADDILLDVPTEDLLDRHAPAVPRLRRFPRRTGLVDNEPVRHLLGWSPRHSVHDGDPADQQLIHGGGVR